MIKKRFVKCKECKKEYKKLYNKSKFCSRLCFQNNISKKWIKNKDEIIRLYKEGYGMNRLGRMFNLHKISVWRHLREWGIETYSHEIEYSDDFWYVMGILEGDGYAFVSKREDQNDKYIIGLETKDKEFAVAFLTSLRNMGLSRHSKNLYKIKKKTYRQGFGWMAKISSKKLLETYENLDLKEILYLQTSYKISFLRGLFDSEGSVSKKHLRVIYNQDKSLIEISEKILYGLNFSYSRYKTLDKGKDYYSLGLLGGKEERNKFIELIKPSIERKNIIN